MSNRRAIKRFNQLLDQQQAKLDALAGYRPRPWYVELWRDLRDAPPYWWAMFVGLSFLSLVYGLL